jgi:hypothetical protein
VRPQNPAPAHAQASLNPAAAHAQALLTLQQHMSRHA